MTREELFERWLLLKNSIQQLASIVQNDTEMTEEDLLEWLNELDRFKRALDELHIRTVRQVRLKK